MPKVTLNKTTKIEGKGLVLAGIEVEVDDKQKKALDKGGFLGEVKKDLSPSNDKEIQSLIKENENLKAQLESGDNAELHEELKTVKAENDELRKDIKSLAGDKEENKSLLNKWFK